eukprot:3209746-Ditylum_brightwellii.AAC.1
MKSVRESINDFDKVYAKAIGILEHCLQITSAVASENVETDEPAIVPEGSINNSSNIVLKVSDGVMKFFPGHRKFVGTAIQINKCNMDGKPIRVWYKNKEEEDYSQEEVDEFQRGSSIPIGNVGFQFVKKFHGGGVFS